ncbi:MULTISPECIES: DUF397 domain-containing protein [unclassified Streptomyces]|uniref:DUF397 domain-containing protein n=1 Tax=unclassified Streptomyces TaxID=2593676 RepID=UPI00081E4A34|nr:MULTISPECIES: DUF397 domain-containing protein [unclassified Streptomyces]MYZ40096.1 DUF397 domain-containing protein [Streptomyces sp. SID4917]SCG06561.1 protein of unknown function [Streptomyces sp. MnatMP-M17]
MESKLNLIGAQWRKSSYSSSTGGDCVECAPVGATWRKSSHSGDTGGQCVEVAACPAAVAVRDSKIPEGPVFTIAPAAFTSFTAYISTTHVTAN